VLVGDHALGRRVIGPERIQPLCDARTERAGEREQHEPENHHPLRSFLGETRQPFAHRRAPSGI